MKRLEQVVDLFRAEGAAELQIDDFPAHLQCADYFAYYPDVSRPATFF